LIVAFHHDREAEFFDGFLRAPVRPGLDDSVFGDEPTIDRLSEVVGFFPRTYSTTSSFMRET
jgi:hypothetical protein